ncbi:MAG: Trp repressor-binding protein [Zetaproteobacteria bacterium CG_4_9_14_3_um_filter_49_83]|nr:MAG: Trp repressor-binding protein [Zetaproteobacteria bacterium CG1_02_49_23]PIQ34420.1 MAG: Trp repressor-binding protein [Zetaproteobacteria bacterium CG17_big_fil_post_rev_8_21_14_2_50_50_13]PIV30938.1 MAG: Trp repressor-binding protein [Zetaproteobacteria bacterium CG02_land_8_20_14_3_00_50_9]PIY56404.1 MAG: Trp repressor-binding protein [Zetaproteobacteria bacterium CG_4_10_14_0_8_um_filter_49_80]PJA34044.1 MAG: Trp repressor-binding protein [Zetaproteobacteria bacterium CG_4_9_14_3_um
MQVLISYHSDYGNTEKMAQSIAAGIRAGCSSANVMLKNVEQTSLNDLQDADVICLGAPVHMGDVSWQMKKFIDEAGKLWMEGALEGKVGAAFVSGGGFGNAGGGAEHALITLHSNMLEHGMLVIGFPKSLLGYGEGGLQWGPYGRSGNAEGMPSVVSEGALAACRSFGAHLAEMAGKILQF